MELIAIARLLWDRRIVVALGVILAVAVGVLAGRDSQARGAVGGSGLGSLQMVLDTTDSQLVEAAPKGSSTLPARAALLADTLATHTGIAIVARAAGVAERQLVIVGPSARKTPVVDSPLVTRVAAAMSSADAPYVVEVFANELTPTIAIAAHAPDASQAGKLTEAAAAGLRSLLVSKDGSKSRGFVLDTVAPLSTRKLAIESRRRLMMVAAAAATFGCWCVCVVLGAGTARRMRRHAVRS